MHSSLCFQMYVNSLALVYMVTTWVWMLAYRQLHCFTVNALPNKIFIYSCHVAFSVTAPEHSLWDSKCQGPGQKHCVWGRGLLRGKKVQLSALGQLTNCILGCISRDVTSGSREVIGKCYFIGLRKRKAYNVCAYPKKANIMLSNPGAGCSTWTACK